ncbi:MAG: 3-oxoacid CoA-transferase subunit B [Proteobacteria bacterium]|nr:3-oxoacid CoA-transferase subunit B [Pseudomonadota bacterium]
MSTLTALDIAQCAANDIAEGSYVNLGIGMPMLVSSCLPRDREFVLHTENGMLGMGPPPPAGEEDMELINAGKQAVTIGPGGSFFHHADSFAMIRGGHIDISILGAYQVAENGDIANWMLPGPKPPAVGGAMDLVAGAKQVWVMLSSHVSKDGVPKVVAECDLPLTGVRCVNRIYSDLAVIDVTDKGLVVSAIVDGLSFEELQQKTGAQLHQAAQMKMLRGSAA